MKNITNIFVSLFYSGFLKKWPGTFGSIMSILILYPIVEYKLIGTQFFITMFILLFFLSIFFIEYYSKYTDTHDSGKIVIDEFLGIYFIFLFYDLIYIFNSFITIFLILIFFRIFDILKIFPANIIDKKMKNSFGVILDDLVASIYTIFILFLINVFS